jgi:phospholipid/cholesterol/gamma-HCH transport system substrate-binding protein
VATRKQKLKVSIFLFVCIGVMVIGSLVVTGIYQKPGIHYWLEFDESILGLYEGGLVEYLGVPVGKVSEIYVTSRQLAHVEVVIDPNKVSLREGVGGKLVIYSIAAGTMAVSLSGGDPTSPELAEYRQIPATKSVIEAFSSQMTKILEDVSVIAEGVRGQLSSLDETAVSDIVHEVRDVVAKGDEFISHTDTLVAETTEVVKDVRGHAEKLMANVEARSVDLERLGKKIEALVETYTKRGEELDVDQIQQQVNDLLEQVTSVAAQMDTTMNNMELVAADVVHQAGNVEYSLRGTMVEMRDAFESIRVMIDQLKEDPSSLVRGKGKLNE